MNGDFPKKSIFETISPMDATFPFQTVEPDMTATPHGNIDELIMMAELQNIKRYGEEFTKFNLDSLADLFEKLDFSATGFDMPEERKEYILKTIRHGDKPGGAVAYKSVEPMQFFEVPKRNKFLLNPTREVQGLMQKSKEPEGFFNKFSTPDPDTLLVSDVRDRMWRPNEQLKILIHELAHLAGREYPWSGHESEWTEQGLVRRDQEWYDEFVTGPLLDQVAMLYPTDQERKKLVSDIFGQDSNVETSQETMDRLRKRSMDKAIDSLLMNIRKK